MSNLTYPEKLKDPRWQRKRLEIMERDNFTCRDCGAKDKVLHIHHSHYGKCEPWDADGAVLLTVCQECHDRRGPVEAYAKLVLSKIMARLQHDPGNRSDLIRFVDSLANKAAHMEEDFDPCLKP